MPSPWVSAQPSPLLTCPRSLPPGLPLPLCSRPIFQLLNLIGEGQLKVRYPWLLLITSQIPPGRNINQKKTTMTTTITRYYFHVCFCFLLFKSNS